MAICAIKNAARFFFRPFCHCSFVFLGNFIAPVPNVPAFISVFRVKNSGGLAGAPLWERMGATAEKAALHKLQRYEPARAALAEQLPDRVCKILPLVFVLVGDRGAGPAEMSLTSRDIRLDASGEWQACVGRSLAPYNFDTLREPLEKLAKALGGRQEQRLGADCVFLHRNRGRKNPEEISQSRIVGRPAGHQCCCANCAHFEPPRKRAKYSGC